MSVPDPEIAPFVVSFEDTLVKRDVAKFHEYLRGRHLPALGGNLTPAEILGRATEQASDFSECAARVSSLLASIFTEEAPRIRQQKLDAVHLNALINGFRLAAALPGTPSLAVALRAVLAAYREREPASDVEPRFVFWHALWRALARQQVDDSLESEWIALLQRPSGEKALPPEQRTLLLEAWKGLLRIPPDAEAQRTGNLIHFDRVERGLLALSAVSAGTDGGGDFIRYALELLSQAYPRSADFWASRWKQRVLEWPDELRKEACLQWPDLATVLSGVDRGDDKADSRYTSTRSGSPLVRSLGEEERTSWRLMLNPDEIKSIQGLLAEIVPEIQSVEDKAFQLESAVYAEELPRRVRKHLHDFKLREPESAACFISGYPLDRKKIGPTPPHWKINRSRSPAIEEEVLLVLFGSLLGDCFGWSTQQDGYIVHDILPIKGHEGEQLGSGSEQGLWWHTEDAFHPYRGDYIGMMCLRNPDGVATTFAPIADLPLTEEQIDLLFKPLFIIRPDESHLRKNWLRLDQVDGELANSYSQIEKMNTAPEKIAVLYGDRRSPYVRIDPYFMDPLEDESAEAALAALVSAIDSRLRDMVLLPGDYCFIDNCKSVHGRKPFRPRYDGTDRWLKRINVARDLRRSRAARHSSESRVVF